MPFARTTVRRRPPLIKRAVAQVEEVPAPNGGWNTRDALAGMPPEDAVVLENWWPNTTTVDVRKGYTPWTASLQGYVETLLAYSGQTTQKLFAATSTGTIYEVTTADSFLTTETGAYLLTESGDNLVLDAVGSSSSQTGLTNGRLQYVNFSTAGGNYIIAANGADDVLSYDGSAWANPSITGVTSANLIGVTAHKERLWFVESGTLRAWYLPVNSIAGAASALDLRSVATNGGYIMAIDTWTIDAGYGVDDLWVAITSNGEVIVYRGTDPASASTWALVGVWQIGEPIGRRCFFKWSGDLLIITRDGILPMSGALQSSRTNPKVALTDKIQSTMAQSALDDAANFGWQMVFYPNANQLYLNVPEVERIRQVQYVMNTITKAWTKFSGWNAGCWVVYNNILYFGGYQFVGRAWDGTSDAGTDISVNAIQAFNDLKRPGRTKRATMFKATFYTNGSPEIFGGLNIDYNTTKNESSLQVQTSLYGTWDTGTWDSSLWAPALDVRNSWNGAAGVGDSFAPTITGDFADIDFQWITSSIVFEQGGIL